MNPRTFKPHWNEQPSNQIFQVFDANLCIGAWNSLSKALAEAKKHKGATIDIGDEFSARELGFVKAVFVRHMTAQEVLDA